MQHYWFSRGVSGARCSGKNSPWHEQAARAATLFGTTSLYSHVIVVAKSGGDYTTLASALGSITDNSATSTYLIWVAPGIYSESNVTMKPYVDIQGAGEDVTKITTVGSPAGQMIATLNGASNAELRYLTVENIGHNAFAVAMTNWGTSPHLSHVTLTSSTGTNETIGMYSSNGASPTTDDVTILVTGAPGTGNLNVGVECVSCTNPVLNHADITVTALAGNYHSYPIYVNYSGSLSVNNVNATVTGTTSDATGIYSNDTSIYVQSSNIEAIANGGSNLGIYTATGSVVRVDDSKVKGSSHTIYTGSSTTVHVGASHLSGGAMLATGPSKCAGVTTRITTSSRAPAPSSRLACGLSWTLESGRRRFIGSRITRLGDASPNLVILESLPLWVSGATWKCQESELVLHHTTLDPK